MFEYNKSGELTPLHHPSLHQLHFDDIEKDPTRTLSDAYDVVLNEQNLEAVL